MRYTLLGFNQTKLIELDLDAYDALILKWFVDFKDSGKMRSITIDDQQYYWVVYAAVLDEYPTIPFKKDTIYRRFKKLVKCQVLGSYAKRGQGHRSYYCSGKNFQCLVSKPWQNYTQYLQSDHWKKFRIKVLRHYGRTCMLCNNGKKVNVHHRTYERLGHELMTDVIVLCRECHEKFHGKTAITS